MCEVALGSEDKRKILVQPDSTLDRQKVFTEEGFRSSCYHVDSSNPGPFFHEERIVCTRWHTRI